MFENILRELERLNGAQISVPIEVDEEGYLDKECPSESCRFIFNESEGTLFILFTFLPSLPERLSKNLYFPYTVLGKDYRLPYGGLGALFKIFNRFLFIVVFPARQKNLVQFIVREQSLVFAAPADPVGALEIMGVLDHTFHDDNLVFTHESRGPSQTARISCINVPVMWPVEN